MANQPVENILYEFLKEHEADFGSDFQVSPSPYDKRSTNNGIEVGDADSNLLPRSIDEQTEFDGLLAVEIFARVQGKDKTDRLPARQKVYDIKAVLLKLFLDHQDLGGRVCSIAAMKQVRFFDDTKADKYAIERIPIVINNKSLGVY
jgi:hypothetical protein